jgi:hypothetical protein
LLPAVEPGGDMVKGDLWHETHSRFKLKETKKSIARAVGLSVQTVRKILRQKQPRGYVREKQESELLSDLPPLQGPSRCVKILPDDP